MNNRKLRITSIQFEGSFVDNKFKDSWTKYDFKSGSRKGEFCGFRITDEARTQKLTELKGVVSSLLNSVRVLNPEIGFDASDSGHALFYIPTEAQSNKFDFAITFEEFEENTPNALTTSIESVVLDGVYFVQIEGSATDKEVREYVSKNLTFLPTFQDLQYDGDADIYLAVFSISKTSVEDFLGQ